MRDDSTADDRLVLSKANDTINLSQKCFCPYFYGFLNEHQVALIKTQLHLTDDCLFWGGYDGAQRVIFGSNVQSTDDFPMCALKFVYKKEYKLSHRDFLGSLMALGIERSTVGDILVFDGEAVVFIKPEISDYVKHELTKIGRVGVTIFDCDLQDFEYEAEYDVVDLTLSSLRLDVFVSAVCSLSRDKSQQVIKSDFVCVNHRVASNVSHQLKITDVITIRKFGKFVFAEDNGFSKKGKYKISVKHFR